MVDTELLLLAAALVLVFALPLGLLAWMAAQYAQMRLLAHRLEGLEVSVSRLRERGSAGAAGTAQHDATSQESTETVESLGPTESEWPADDDDLGSSVDEGELGPSDEDDLNLSADEGRAP